MSAIEEREIQVGRVWEKLCGCQEKTVLVQLLNLLLGLLHLPSHLYKRVNPFLVGCWARVLEASPYFRPQNVFFITLFVPNVHILLQITRITTRLSYMNSVHMHGDLEWVPLSKHSRKPTNFSITLGEILY